MTVPFSFISQLLNDCLLVLVFSLILRNFSSCVSVVKWSGLSRNFDTPIKPNVQKFSYSSLVLNKEYPTY